MPTFSRVSHISFSVRDAGASAGWWTALLELTSVASYGSNTSSGLPPCAGASAK